MSYDRDLTDREIYLKRFDTLIDLQQEMLDILRMILENQKIEQPISEAIEISDYPSGISKDHHLHIQQEGLRGAVEDLLKATRAGNQNAVNEATYCALIRLIQIVNNLGKRVLNA